MPLPKISVIMAVYNAAKYLPKSIQSILTQSFKDFEFIIINDHSEDESEKIINYFAKLDSRVIALNNPVNRGLTFSLNRCLKSARGEYIARQDADDISLSSRLQEQYDYLESNPDFCLIGSSAQIINERGKTISSYLKQNRFQKTASRLAKRNTLLHSSIMFREKNISYREKFYYSQDYDLYLRLLTQGEKITNLEKPLIQYRYHQESISFKKLKIQKEFAEIARKFYNQRLKSSRDEYASFDPQKIIRHLNHPSSLLPISLRILAYRLFPWMH